MYEKLPWLTLLFKQVIPRPSIILTNSDRTLSYTQILFFTDIKAITEGIKHELCLLNQGDPGDQLFHHTENKSI